MDGPLVGNRKQETVTSSSCERPSAVADSVGRRGGPVPGLLPQVVLSQVIHAGHSLAKLEMVD